MGGLEVCLESNSVWCVRFDLEGSSTVVTTSALHRSTGLGQLRPQMVEILVEQLDKE